MTKKKDVEIVVDPGNARVHDERNQQVIQQSLRELGAGRSIVIDKTGQVIAGNEKYRQAKALGLPVKIVESDGQTLIVVRRKDLAPEDERRRALAIADNRSSDLSEFDMGILANTLKEAGPALRDAMGFTEKELAQVFRQAQPKDLKDPPVPAAPEEPRTKLGQLFALGPHRLLCGDAVKAKDVKRLMSDAKASFCFTSPPYSDMRDYGNADLSVDYLKQFLKTGAKYCDFFALNLGLQRKDGEIHPYWDQYIAQARKVGLKFTAWNIWNRSQMGGSIANMSAMFPIEHEWILVFGGDKERVRPTRKNKTPGVHLGITNRQKDGSTKRAAPKEVKEFGRIGSVYTGCYEAGNIDHPATFPVHLPAEYINACSEIGEIVYDPFLGSGTTLIAADQLERVCYGLEIDPGYCDVIIRRYAEFKEIDLEGIYATANVG